MDVELSDGTCAELALEDTAAIQTVDVKGQEITSVTVSVVDVVPGESTATTVGLVAISEVVVQHR